MVSGEYKLPLVWIDLEMTGMYCFNSFNWHSVPWLGQEKRILVRNIWLYKICNIKHVSEVNGSILPGIALICKKCIAVSRSSLDTTDKLFLAGFNFLYLPNGPKPLIFLDK